MRSLAKIIMLWALAVAPAFGADVGFGKITIPNGSEPALSAGVWYPTDAAAAPHALGSATQSVALDAPIAGRHLPLVVISHGGGGWYGSHYDTALALAHAGFVVAAVSHAGDTFDDQSGVLQLWRRPAQLHQLLDYMLGDWPWRARLNADRVGAFGFSNGGFTVLVAVGGVPDLSKIGAYCEAHANHDLCEALKRAGVDPRSISDIPAGAWIHDSRIKAAAIAAPAFGFAFGRAGLSRVSVPIQLWGGADDRHQPAPYYEDAVRANLPRPPDYHVVAAAGHDDFLPPCDSRLRQKAPDLCISRPGFDRSAFHGQFNADLVRFFQANLR